MGLLGVKGTFQHCCELTLRILQEKMTTLMPMLQVLMYHPFAHWKRRSSNIRNEKAENFEKINEKAATHFMNVEKRLKGYVSIIR